ncbi:peptide-methionine (R)-S-oxide reductase MsrB [Confluentibacter sediminis]|uniref:peptide-methionine (R)-S-oxide reductase MsrB n=1 Tax=Confluentibacter sediminis TaxID=2219045 RepID=UPI000DACAA3E|nr:peptide-methionine (R)-S-oxide reductase MsrB [Confluentibacter sediminis]
MKKILILSAIITLMSCNSNAQKKNKTDKVTNKVTKTDAGWEAQLTDMEYYVLRQNGTEPAFSSPLNKNYAEGTYVCKGCDTPLFKSEHKFDSGTGWPSFDREIKGNVAFSNGSDYYGREEHCAVCGGHLGHVFNDGPKNTTGKRHCINGVSLKFIQKK